MGIRIFRAPLITSMVSDLPPSPLSRKIIGTGRPEGGVCSRAREHGEGSTVGKWNIICLWKMMGLLLVSDDERYGQGSPNDLGSSRDKLPFPVGKGLGVRLR
jgi:hypothetical protein